MATISDTIQENKEVQPDILYWNEDDQAKVNYRNLGQRLAENGDLFRHADHTIGLLRVLDDGEYREITTAKTLGPVIVDRIPVLVVKDGKVKGSRIATAHLDSMLRAEAFLSNFRRVDTFAWMSWPMRVGVSTGTTRRCRFIEVRPLKRHFVRGPWNPALT
jgi:hypothetical protein